MKKLFFMAVAAMAALSSCTSDNELELNKTTGKEALTFTATMEDSEATRATLGTDKDGKKYAAWEKNDQISINGKTYSAQEAGTTSTFTADGEGATGDTYNAYFPANLCDNDTPTLPANVSETWAKGQFNMPMYATSTSNTTLAFKNLCGVLQITVKSDQLTSVKSITVSSSNCATSGEFTVNASTYAAELTNATNTANTATVTYTTAVTTDEDGEVFYVAIPAQTYKNLSIAVSDGTTAKVMTTKKDQDIVVARNTIYPITFNGYHEYVDLGLSVKWATCNVGASSPEEYGDYYAWGETETKGTYSWSTYKWCNGSENTLTKYCTSSSYGTVDNKTVLDQEDDVAQVKWGGSWRMPTDTEMTELRENCTWTWTTQGGKNGYEVTSKKNGNSVFLPAAGYRDGSSLGSAGSYGRYWSSSLYTSSPGSALFVRFYSSAVRKNNDRRYYGQSVRPVCP